MPTETSTLTEEKLYGMIARELFAGATSTRDRVGLELELQPVRRAPDGLRALRLRDRGAERGLLPWLRELGSRCAWEVEVDPYDNLSARLPDGGCLTLEPAGQIEYSGTPFGSASEAIDDLERFVDVISREGAGEGISLAARGYNAYCKGRPRLEIAKPRYIAMDQHFSAIGRFGRKMMRATCALQVNLDFGGTEEAAERWRLANMIAPSLNAMFANAPAVCDRRRYRSFRYEIWRRLDPSRTGRLYDRPDLDPVADYLRFALDASVMMVDAGGGAFHLPERPMTFRDWLGGAGEQGHPDWSDWRIHLSTLFPDVRARGYMEIRPIDALPREYRFVAVRFIDRLLRDPALRRAALERIEARERRREPGEHEHDGFWRSDYETGRELFLLFLEACSAAERPPFRAYLDEFLDRGLTPADLPLMMS